MFANRFTTKPIDFVCGINLCPEHAKEFETDPLALCTDSFWKLVDHITEDKSLLPVDRDTIELKLVKGSTRQYGMN
jgi:hypothetical protein